MQIGAADAAGAKAQQHFPRPGIGNVGGLDAQVFLGVDAAGKHVRLLKCGSALRQCSMSQPVEKRLYA